MTLKKFGQGWRPAAVLPTGGPLDVLKWSMIPLEIPDPITFIVGKRWLNRPNLYPRQATIIKVIFLREDLFTPFDYDVIEEWTDSFRVTGNNGMQIDVLERMRWLRVNGYHWFREVVAAIGRRGSKGHLGALATAYVLWHYMAKMDPQEHYGIDRDKKLQALVFAGKRDQAKTNLWGDIVNIVIGANCFTPYISRVQAETLSIYAPSDNERKRKQLLRGIQSDIDQATFQIIPKESTLMAGRGPTAFLLAFDEMAHVVASGANRSADEVYGSSTPALDQFGKDGFIYEPSSTWQMAGQFYENYVRSQELDDDGSPVYPDLLMMQLTSWQPYQDWERATHLPLFPPGFRGDNDEYVVTNIDGIPESKLYVGEDGAHIYVPLGFKPLKGAIQAYDDAMRRLKRANPETFAVERESKWAATLDAYLNEEKVKEIFAPWNDRELVMQVNGVMVIDYKAHGDPSRSNANFGFALAHPETVLEERIKADGTVVIDSVTYCIFDIIHHFDPADFPDHTIDYEQVEDWIWEKVITRFYPTELTFDQWNSASTIQKFQKKVRTNPGPKRVQVFEKTATSQYNWSRAETFKTAINMGWVKAPYYELAELELRFLQLVNGKVEHPTIGPVQTKDVADCMMECVQVIIGDQVNNFLSEDLSALRPGAVMPGGADPFPRMREDPMAALSGFAAARNSGRDATGGQFGRARQHRLRQHRS